MDFINKELDTLASNGLARTLTMVEGPQGTRVRVGGAEKILLCSNDYLGLANHPALKDAATEAIAAWGVGAGASRSISGTMESHVRLEERIKSFKQTPAALLFNSGYHANLGVIAALAGRTTEIFSDKLNHASILDACVLSRAKLKRYPHRDVDALEAMLRKSNATRKLIVTDGVFSMDGTIAPVGDIAALLDRYNATLVVDDAHGTGVLGENGRGTLEHLGVSHPSIVQMGTLGKALGTFGGFIAGSAELIRLLISTARPFIYTTALPPSVCAAAACAIDLVEESPGPRDRLRENMTFFRDGLARAGIETVSSETPIIPILIGDAQRTMEISKRLMDKGIFVQGIRPPSVPEGTSRLRVTVTAAHTIDELTRALGVIEEVLHESQDD